MAEELLNIADPPEIEEEQTIQIPYYPGCTLNTVASDFDQSARRSAKLLGFELTELSKWNCCGASFPLTPDNVMGLTGSANVLINAGKEGDQVATLCSFCYNTLKRTNYAINNNEETKEVLNDFLETDYQGDVKVLHFLEILRDIVGFDVVKEKATRPLKGLKVAAYYGCMLLRPQQEVAIDSNHESPQIFESFLTAIGCTPIDYPDKGECCGSHLAMSEEDIVVRLSGRVIDSAASAGAEMITTTCPLCFYNLERAQEARTKVDPSYAGLPIIYFTQILALALGDEVASLALDRGNGTSPAQLLTEKEII